MGIVSFVTILAVPRRRSRASLAERTQSADKDGDGGQGSHRRDGGTDTARLDGPLSDRR
jgi:hypothetical protein